MGLDLTPCIGSALFFCQARNSQQAARSGPKGIRDSPDPDYLIPVQEVMGVTKHRTGAGFDSACIWSYAYSGGLKEVKHGS